MRSLCEQTTLLGRLHQIHGAHLLALCAYEKTERERKKERERRRERERQIEFSAGCGRVEHRGCHGRRRGVLVQPTWPSLVSKSTHASATTTSLYTSDSSQSLLSVPRAPLGKKKRQSGRERGKDCDTQIEREIERESARSSQWVHVGFCQRTTRRGERERVERNNFKSPGTNATMARVARATVDMCIVKRENKNE